MKKIGEKVALVAQICVAVVFVIVSLLYVANLIPQGIWQDNTILFVVMSVLAVVFVGTSAYLVWQSFSEAQNIKHILLYADCKSSTTTSGKVITKIAKNCASKVHGIKIKKTKIRDDEKRGYTATFVVEVSAQTVTPALEQLRCLIEDSFKNTLGLVLNTITFEVTKLTSEPKSDVKRAQKRAKAIADGADQVQDIYHNPTGERPTDIVLPLPSDTTTSQVDSSDFHVETPTDVDTDVAVDELTDFTDDGTDVVEQVDDATGVTDGRDSAVAPADSVAGDTFNAQAPLPTDENFDESDG